MLDLIGSWVMFTSSIMKNNEKENFESKEGNSQSQMPVEEAITA